jgi:hypothetical protein
MAQAKGILTMSDDERRARELEQLLADRLNGKRKSADPWIALQESLNLSKEVNALMRRLAMTDPTTPKL